MTASLIADDRDGLGARLSRIVYRPTESLKVNPKSPKRTHEKQIAQGMGVGNMVPILAGPDLHVIGGHGRLLAIADPLLDSTAPGDIVLGSSLGSGTTLIAAERVRWHCYPMEIHPLYVGLRNSAMAGLHRRYRHSHGCRFDEINRTLGDEE